MPISMSGLSNNAITSYSSFTTASPSGTNYGGPYTSVKVGPLRIVSGQVNKGGDGGQFYIYVSADDFDINRIAIANNTYQYFQSQYWAATLNGYGGNPNPLGVNYMPYLQNGSLVIPVYSYGTQPGGNNFSAIFTIIGFAK
jgi:hypothetical protein